MKVFIEKIDTYDFEKIYDFLKSLTSLWQKLEGKETILLKPNLLGAFSPDKAVTTHPIILDALITILKEKNKTIMLGDSPGGTTPVSKVWQETGMKELAEKHQIKLVNFSKGGVVSKKAKTIEFNTSKYFWEADAVINVSKYKTHSLVSYTGAVKNLYGLIPGLKKSDFHRDYPDPIQFSKVITELYSIAREKVTFNIMDGIKGMEGEGPSAGEPRNFGIIFACESASAIDYIASKMMGFNPEKNQYITACLDLDNIKPDEIVIPEEWKNFIFKKVKIKKVKTLVKILAYSPSFLKNAFRKLFRYYPDFNEKCVLCNVCVESCPVQVIEIKEGNKTPTIDYKNCIKCMCCHELCPYQAVYIKKSFLAKFLIR